MIYNLSHFTLCTLLVNGHNHFCLTSFCVRFYTCGCLVILKICLTVCSSGVGDERELHSNDV